MNYYKRREFAGAVPNAAKVCQLFAGKRGNGVTHLAKELNVDPNIVYRWMATEGWGAKGGLVPPQYNQAILEAADRRGIPREKFKGLLQDTLCPCCGQELPQALGA